MLATSILMGVMLSLMSTATATANDFDYLPYVKGLAPEVHLHPNEEFFPSSVDFYVNRCRLYWTIDGSEVHRTESTEDLLAGGGHESASK
ncbi:hypothetical protein OAH18_01690 [bacterium]|nr:hypothetical protein [bacterium]